MKYILYLSLVFGGLILGSGCQQESVKEQIDNYIAKKGLTATSTAEGLYYIIEKPGGEEKPTIDSKVTVDYKGTLLNDKVFDSSYDRGTPFTSNLTQVIKGWQLGIPLFGKGGKGMLIIPPSLGYGSQRNGDIPANSVLVFEIELLDF